MVLASIIVFIVAVCFYQSFAYRRMYSYVSTQLNKQPGLYCPRVAVILPCKGLDPDFEDNLHKLFAQKYGSGNTPAFEIIFAVASENDPAHPVIAKAMRQNPHINSKLVIAGIDNKRAQKITNQLEAIKHTSAQTEVLVFVDSDVIARTDFLEQLVTPLQDEKIGIATGYRFYLPFKFSFPALIRSLWNRLSAWELASDKFSFAWGGAMAIRRETFVAADITQVWDRSADDDLAMTTAVKRLGLAVHFVPQCLVVSHGDATWAEVLEWTNRQLILTKVYYPALWLMGVIRAFVMALWLVLVLVLTFQIVCLHVYKFLPVLSAASILLVVEIYFLYRSHRLWRGLLSQGAGRSAEQQLHFDKAYKDLLWQSAIAVPLAHIILPVMTLYSLITNRIRWRGINYELKSPQETLVV